MSDRPAPPLKGVRVIELGWYVAGPVSGRILASQGAEVIKIETSKRLDPMRLGPYFEGEPSGAAYSDYGANKRSVTLDIRSEEGRNLMYELIKISDVFTENFSVEAVSRFGLDYERLAAINPQIIMVRQPAMGVAGPYRDYASFGINMQGFAGINYITGMPDVPAVGPSLSLPDYLTGVNAALAAVIALDYRRRTGKGQFVELSQFESAATLLGPTVLDYVANGRVAERQGNRHPYTAPHGAYACAGDDRWITIAVFSDAQWEGLLRVMGKPGWAADERFSTALNRKRNEDALDANIGAWTATLDPHEAMSRLQAAGVPAGVVQQTDDLIDRDEHLRARGYWEKGVHPRWGEVHYHGVPIRLSESPQAPFEMGVELGASNDYVFGELLGLSQGEIQRLTDQGVIA